MQILRERILGSSQRKISETAVFEGNAGVAFQLAKEHLDGGASRTRITSTEFEAYCAGLTDFDNHFPEASSENLGEPSKFLAQFRSFVDERISIAQAMLAEGITEPYVRTQIVEIGTTHLITKGVLAVLLK